MNLREIWKKLFSTYFILGVANLLIAFVFLYFSSTHLLRSRTQDQLASVNALASQQLDLYLTHIKNLSTQFSSVPLQSPETLQSVFSDSLTALLVQDGKEWEEAFGHWSLDKKSLRSLKEFSFSMDQKFIFLRIPSGSKDFFWVFNMNGVNQLLARHEGLGKTGEIYLIGNDQRIKSGSRHIKDWEDTLVPPEIIAAVSGTHRGVHEIKDYRGVEVISFFSNFKKDDLNFYLLSEIDTVEVFRDLNEAFPKNLIYSFTVFLGTILLGILSSRGVIRVVSQMKKRVNRFNLDTIAALEEEKKKISLYLSETISQKIEHLENVIPKEEKEAQATCLSLKADFITILNDLNPLEMSSENLFETIEKYLQREGKEFGVSMNFWYNQRLGEKKQSPSIETNILRIVQELVRNVFTQSELEQASVIISKQDSDVLYRFEFVGPKVQIGTQDLKLLQYRADVLEGRIELEETGTSLVVKFFTPLDSKQGLLTKVFTPQGS